MLLPISVTSRTLVHLPKPLLPSWLPPERTRLLTKECDTTITDTNNNKNEGGGIVVYWMQRDVRAVDNWALLFARHLSEQQVPSLHVVYALAPPPLPTNAAAAANDVDLDDEDLLPPTLIDMPMTERHGKFLLGGLEQVHQALSEKHIPFHILQPPSQDKVGQTVCKHIESLNAICVVCDLPVLREPRHWIEAQAAPLLEKAQVPLYQVDAHNIVPVWLIDKRQVGARTLRPRIHKHLKVFFKDNFPELQPNKKKKDQTLPEFDRAAYESFLQMDDSVSPVDWHKPGTAEGMKQFDRFVRTGLKEYDKLRNDPTQTQICSNLSPWINHGHVSFQRIALKLQKLNKYATGSASFFEEGVVRRELSDNFCYYSPNTYDSLEAAAGWAQETLQTHASDDREWLYTVAQLERGETHDDLWNAAQLQVVQEGQMHGFLRMYWAKKILEWTASPELAIRTAQYFNDKYALDGKDPNGFVGVGWSIMGIHDQGWKERQVFGKIRYMNYNGCKRKFNVQAFVARYPQAVQNAAAVNNSAKAKKEELVRKMKQPGGSSASKKRKTAK